MILFLLLALALPHPARAQQPATANRTQLIAVARRIMTAARYAALITEDSTGRSQARTIDPFAPDSLMSVWFATNPRTRKVGEIKRDPRVTLYYFDPRTEGFVTILGRARLVNDRAEKAKRWKPAWKGLYPDRDSSYLLVEVTPERLEIVSVKDKIHGDAVTWKPPAVEFRKRP